MQFCIIFVDIPIICVRVSAIFYNLLLYYFLFSRGFERRNGGGSARDPGQNGAEEMASHLWNPW